ncbi:hypothetical protein TWF788_007113 [Orbilia oligospora]|uniref:Uncharacterized protein n=1 Tax=Orbilia oligospora TaxID=2813651 RepID=A0A7C8TSI9_ORBOL|nr:hypothetical protein TWF788_007113 [Orbilia oligospora]
MLRTPLTFFRTLFPGVSQVSTISSNESASSSSSGPTNPDGSGVKPLRIALKWRKISENPEETIIGPSGGDDSSKNGSGGSHDIEGEGFMVEHEETFDEDEFTRRVLGDDGVSASCCVPPQSESLVREKKDDYDEVGGGGDKRKEEKEEKEIKGKGRKKHEDEDEDEDEGEIYYYYYGRDRHHDNSGEGMFPSMMFMLSGEDHGELGAHSPVLLSKPRGGRSLLEDDDDDDDDDVVSSEDDEDDDDVVDLIKESMPQEELHSLHMSDDDLEDVEDEDEDDDEIDSDDESELPSVLPLRIVREGGKADGSGTAPVRGPAGGSSAGAGAGSSTSTAGSGSGGVGDAVEEVNIITLDKVDEQLADPTIVMSND